MRAERNQKRILQQTETLRTRGCESCPVGGNLLPELLENLIAHDVGRAIGAELLDEARRSRKQSDVSNGLAGRRNELREVWAKREFCRNQQRIAFDLEIEQAEHGGVERRSIARDGRQIGDFERLDLELGAARRRARWDFQNDTQFLDLSSSAIRRR